MPVCDWCGHECLIDVTYRIFTMYSVYIESTGWRNEERDRQTRRFCSEKCYEASIYPNRVL